MRRSWVVAVLTVGVVAAAACTDSAGGAGDGDAPDTRGDEEVCAATEQAMTDLGTELQAALTSWDGSPEEAGAITEVADRWAQGMRGVAADASDPQLREMLEDLATELEEFGTSWQDAEADPDIGGVEEAVQPLEDRCGFGAATALAGEAAGTAEVCADALAAAGSSSFTRVRSAADEVSEALAAGDRVAFDHAVTDLRAAAGGFARDFRKIAAQAPRTELRTALYGIADEVETWATSVEDGQPDDLAGFQGAVRTLGALCERPG